LSKAESWSVASEQDEFLRASIDPKWSGGMPRTLQIPPTGEMVRMRGVADFSALNTWLGATARG
jgi:hypothetical protein